MPKSGLFLIDIFCFQGFYFILPDKTKYQQHQQEFNGEEDKGCVDKTLRFSQVKEIRVIYIDLVVKYRKFKEYPDLKNIENNNVSNRF